MPFGRRDRRVLRVAAGRERVRRRLRDDVAPSASAGRPRCARSADDVDTADGPGRPPWRGTSAGRSCPRTSTSRSSSRRRTTKPSIEPLRAAERLAEEEQQRAHRAEQQCRLQCVGHISILFRRAGRPLSVPARRIIQLMLAVVRARAAGGARRAVSRASRCRSRFRGPELQPAAARRRRRRPAAAQPPAAPAAPAPADGGADRSDARRADLSRARSSSRRTTPAAASGSTSSASAASFVDLVTYYRTLLKQRGELVFDVPATHEFDVGRFREETMAFPPGVTIKDFQSEVSQGYPEPEAGRRSRRGSRRSFRSCRSRTERTEICIGI